MGGALDAPSKAQACLLSPKACSTLKETVLEKKIVPFWPEKRLEKEEIYCAFVPQSELSCKESFAAVSLRAGTSL